MANGKPWDQLSTNMQRTILYSHILESVSNNLGSTMQDNTAMRMAAFTATLADVKLALGQAFLPIMYNVLPLLTTLAQWLYKTLQVIAAFTKALFGGFTYGKGAAAQTKATDDQTAALNKQAGAIGGVGKAQEKAGKKAKKAAKDAKGGVAAFDEVNTLADKAGAAGAGAGAGGGGGAGAAGPAMPAMPAMAIPTPDASGFVEAINGMVEHFKKVLEPIKTWFMENIWTPIASFFKTKLAEMSLYWTKYGADFMSGLKVILAFFMPIIAFLANFIWESIKGAIDGILKFFRGLMKFVGGIFAGDWKRVWSGFKDMVFGAIQAIWNITNLTFVGRIFGVLKLFLKSGKGILTSLVSFFKNSWGNVAKNTVSTVKNLVSGIKKPFKDFSDWLIKQLFNWGLKFYEWKTKAGKAGSAAWAAIKKVFWGAADWFARSIVNPIVNKFDNIKTAFKSGFASGMKAVINNWIRALNSPINSLKGFSVAGKKPFAFLPTFHTLAKGGVTTGPTFALIGEGNEDEAVAPLSKLQGMIANSVLAAMKAGGGGGGGDVILNIDGRRFARLVKPHLERENRRVGSNVRLNPI